MPAFNGKISAEFTPPKTWVLSRSLSFKTTKLTPEDINILKTVGADIATNGRITCDKGMKTDLASVPRACWAFIAPWDVARAAVIHDHLYSSLRVFYHSTSMSGEKNANRYANWKKGRALSDKIFLLGMKAAEPSVPKWKMYSAYWSVRLFGRWPASAKE